MSRDGTKSSTLPAPLVITVVAARFIVESLPWVCRSKGGLRCMRGMPSPPCPPLWGQAKAIWIRTWGPSQPPQSIARKLEAHLSSNVPTCCC